MQALLVFLSIAALSLLASSRLVLDAGRLPVLARLSASGLLFLLFGVALGPQGAGAIRAEDLAALRPLIALGLGLAGLVLGLNLDVRLLRLVPRPVYFAAAAHSCVAFVAVTVPLVGAWWKLGLGSVRSVLGATAVLGAAACVSSGHLAVLATRTGRLERSQGLAVALLAMLDDVLGLGLLGLALFLSAGSGLAEGAALLGAALGLGAGCGLLVAFLSSRLEDAGELTAVVLGAVALVAGSAAYLRISPLLTGVACGATLAFVGGRSVDREVRTLERFERPVFLVLVFLGGCIFNPRDGMAWAMVPGFVALRFAGKVLGGAMAQRLAAPALTLPPRLGYALIAQGGLALCLAIEFVGLIPSETSQRVFDVVVVGTLLNELLAHQAFRSVASAPVRKAVR